MNQGILGNLNAMFRYGNHHRTVRHIRHIPSYRFSNNFGPYDSSSTAAAEGKGAEADDAATSLSPPSPLRSNIQLKNILTYIFSYIIINTYHFLF